MDNVKFGYFQAKTPNGNGYVCVALKRPSKEKSSIEAHFAGFALCSPKDHFNKKLARKIALGRLENFHLGKNRVQFITATSSTGRTIAEALYTLLRRDDVPGWLKRAGRRNEIVFGLKQEQTRKRFGERLSETVLSVAATV